MGLGATVLTDLMTGELRAPSNFKSVLGRETLIAMPARRPGSRAAAASAPHVSIRGKFMGLYELYMDVNG